MNAVVVMPLSLRMASVMASLNSFKSDLALEQDINSNTAGRRGIDADAQFIRTDTDELKEAHKKQQLGLGHAFLVLFQANRSAIKRAIYDTSAESMKSYHWFKYSLVMFIT